MTSSQPEISVDTNDPTPPYEQIRKQIAHTIGSGALKAGDRLAPVRQLAGDLRVAPGTVARAYRELESAGFVITKRGGGTRVAATAPRLPHPFPDDSPTPSTTSQAQRVASYGVAQHNGEVLLVHSSIQSKLAGTWFLPGGGIDWGESPEEAVVREFREETGLEIEVEGLLDVSSAINAFDDETLHTVRIIYAVNVVGGVLRAEAGGTTDAAEWMPRARVGELNVADFVVRALAAIS